ncbi:putative gamma-secretase subunit PEN-2 [Micractinium conductrix]|uniref:Gamma-secretase subunit PEN-2 n=1 Tax=Micractinium conductrix TaxID=554055 RepID=A0A2P6V8U3_9CHLO|nr:putative gamma-secretase subunit PEN-2 [Micractinium conductrix]|eukprot:PSC70501.1 putative gamma-secretase subunit PEN-2 [Micractinium conductrix]
MAAASVGELTLSPVLDVDGGAQPALQARRTARLYYLLGFAALPWFWACNVWLFLPDFWHGDRDPVVTKYTRRSALGFAVYTALFLPWMLLYLIAGEKVLGQRVFDKLDINSLDLSGSGLGAG